MKMTHAFIAALQDAHAERPAPEPVGNPRTMALAYRIKAHCDAIEWNCTMGECAADLGVSLARVRSAAKDSGWSGQFRSAKQDDARLYSGGSGSQSIAMTTKLHEVSEVPRMGWVAE